jgi:hypothetical protein
MEPSPINVTTLADRTISGNEKAIENAKTAHGVGGLVFGKNKVCVPTVFRWE